MSSLKGTVTITTGANKKFKGDGVTNLLFQILNIVSKQGVTSLFY